MMHFRERIMIIDKKQSEKYKKKYTDWRRTGRRQKCYKKFPEIQKKRMQ